MKVKQIHITRLGEEDFSYSIPADDVAGEKIKGAQLKIVLSTRLEEGTSLDTVMSLLNSIPPGESVIVRIKSDLHGC